MNSPSIGSNIEDNPPGERWVVNRGAEIVIPIEEMVQLGFRTVQICDWVRGDR